MPPPPPSHYMPGAMACIAMPCTRPPCSPRDACCLGATALQLHVTFLHYYLPYLYSNACHRDLFLPPLWWTASGGRYGRGGTTAGCPAQTRGSCPPPTPARTRLRYAERHSRTMVGEPGRLSGEREGLEKNYKSGHAPSCATMPSLQNYLAEHAWQGRTLPAGEASGQVGCGNLHTRTTSISARYWHYRLPLRVARDIHHATRLAASRMARR